MLGDAVDRLHEAAAVARLHLRHPLERLRRAEPGRHVRSLDDDGAPVARDPERRLPAGARRRAAPGRERREQDEQPGRQPLRFNASESTGRFRRSDEQSSPDLTSTSQATSHASAFERTAPASVALTSPWCWPTQAAPFACAPSGRRRAGPPRRPRWPCRCRPAPARGSSCAGPLQHQRRRPAVRAEVRPVPEDEVAVLQRHRVGADRRRDAVHLEDPAARRRRRVAADLVDVRPEAGRPSRGSRTRPRGWRPRARRARSP